MAQIVELAKRVEKCVVLKQLLLKYSFYFKSKWICLCPFLSQGKL